MNFGQGIALAVHNLQNLLWEQNNSSYFQMNICLYCKKNRLFLIHKEKRKWKKNQNTCDDAFCWIKICLFFKCKKGGFFPTPLPHWSFLKCVNQVLGFVLKKYKIFLKIGVDFRFQMQFGHVFVLQPYLWFRKAKDNYK